MTVGRPDEDPALRADLAEVRASLRAEWRAEREAAEREARRYRWQQRSLIDLAREVMRRGDRVAVHAAPRLMVEGVVIDLGRDYALVATAHRDVAVRLIGPTGGDEDPLSWWGCPHVAVVVRERARAGGTSAASAASTFLSVLRRYSVEQEGGDRRLVEVGSTILEGPLTGRIQAVATDHLYARDRLDREVFVALSSITYLAWTDPDF